MQVLVVDALVTLEGDPVDDRVLDDLDDQRVAFAPEVDVGEQAGREQRLQRVVDPLGVERIARRARR